MIFRFPDLQIYRFPEFQISRFSDFPEFQNDCVRDTAKTTGRGRHFAGVPHAVVLEFWTARWSAQSFWNCDGVGIILHDLFVCRSLYMVR